MNQIKKSSPLIKIDFLTPFFTREIAEIPKLLMPGEELICAIGGFYSAGTATLCVTSERVLLIDKKLVRLSYEDIRFQSINEINYSHQMLLASLNLYLPARKLQFRTWYKNDLRALSQLIEQKMFESRTMTHSEQKSLSHQTPGHVGSFTRMIQGSESAQIKHGFFPSVHLWGAKRLDAPTRWRRAGKFLTSHALY